MQSTTGFGIPSFLQQSSQQRQTPFTPAADASQQAFRVLQEQQQRQQMLMQQQQQQQQLSAIDSQHQLSRYAYAQDEGQTLPQENYMNDSSQIRFMQERQQQQQHQPQEPFRVLQNGTIMQNSQQTREFPYSFVGMQHSWAKAVLPSYAGPAFAVKNQILRESEIQAESDTELDVDDIAMAKAAAIRARGASPVEELFDAVKVRKLASSQQAQVDANVASQQKIDELEKQNQRLKSALVSLRDMFASLKEEVSTQSAKFDVLQEYAMNLEAENHTLRGQVNYMQQFFPARSFSAASNPDDTDSTTALANGSSFYYPGPTYEHLDSYEEHVDGFVEEGGENADDDEYYYGREEGPYDPDGDEDDDDEGLLDDEEEDDESDFRQYEDLEPTTALQL